MVKSMNNNLVNSFDWSKYPLHESTRPEIEKCKAIINVHKSIIGIFDIENLTEDQAIQLQNHIEIIKRNQCKLLLLGVTYG